MSDDRITRSGRKSYPPSPSKSVERRSSTDSSSSERVTRSGKRLRTSDSEDETPGSPQKSNPPSPSKRAKIDPNETVLKVSKRLRIGESEDPSGSVSELSPIKENNHDGNPSLPSNVDALLDDDSDPEVSFKEGSFRVEDEKVEDELLASDSGEDDADMKESKQDDNQDVSSDTSKGKDCVPGSDSAKSGEDTTAGNEDNNTVKNTEEEIDKQLIESVKDEAVGETELEPPQNKDIIENVDEVNKKATTESKDDNVKKSGDELEKQKPDDDSGKVDESVHDVAKKDNSEEKSTVDISSTNDKEKSDTEKSDNKEMISTRDQGDSVNREKTVDDKTDTKLKDSEVAKDSDVANETKGNSDEVEEMDVDKPHDLSANRPQDLSVTKNNVDGEKDKENNSKSANKPNEDSKAEKDRIQKLREERANSSSPDDVIVLSDDSSGPMMNGVSDDSDCSPAPPRNGVKKLTPTEMSEREKLVRKLQEELRNEEAKLLLLKKLRQSQLQPVLVKDQTPNQGVVPGKLPIPRNPTAPPPPLLRGGQQMMKSQQVIMPPLVRGNQIQPIRTQGSQGPPPLMLGARGGVHIQQQSQMVRPPIVRVGSGSNLVAYNTNTPTTYTLVQQGQSQQQVKISTSPATGMAAESPASRQAAAKLALRKQLEKTLLQIPPPKPPPPEMHFLPSAANNEFIYLVGLEEVVNRITEDMIGPKTPKYIEPFTCSQCKLDFTTVWKRDPKKSSAVMCETCVVTNQKKALKAEHTNRLKTAFVKALQQEQEIEQRMSQTVTTVPANASQAPQAHTSSHHREQLQKVQQEQMRQHHQMLQAHQQQMQRHHVRPIYGQIPQAHIQPTITYAYPVPQVMMTKPQVITTLAQPTDRQREYLLDMIPSRSISQTVAWKQ